MYLGLNNPSPTLPTYATVAHGSSPLKMSTDHDRDGDVDEN